MPIFLDDEDSGTGFVTYDQLNDIKKQNSTQQAVTTTQEAEPEITASGEVTPFQPSEEILKKHSENIMADETVVLSTQVIPYRLPVRYKEIPGITK